MQAVIARRFVGLGPGDLPAGVRVVCAAAVQPPRALQELWINVDGAEQRLELTLSESLLESTSIMIAVCDVFDKAQVEHVTRILEWLAADEVAPPVILLPVHTSSQTATSRSISEALKDQDVINKCLDDVVCGEPDGFALALAIHASVAKAEMRVEKWVDKLRNRSALAEEMHDLKASVDATMWQYVPQRLHIVLPPVDYNLGDQHSRQFAGYAIQQRLTFGADELVYQIEPPAGVAVAPGGEMVKVVPKSTVQKSIDAIRRVQRTWQIMQTLSGRWSHPNIARSLQIYHSPTCLYMRMEHGGTESLYQRLKGRGSRVKTLSASQLRALIAQLADVVKHLHTGPRVCHRDIKPENVALTDAAEGGPIVLKLVNFDTAAVQRPGGKCKLKSGTFPFVAPEVADHKYDGMAADMWSLGILFFEMACGIGIIERAVSERDVSGQDIEVQTRGFPRKAVQQVCDAFADKSCVNKILTSYSVPELSEILPWYKTALHNLNQVSPSQRWTSEQLVEALPAISDVNVDLPCKEEVMTEV